MLNTMMRDTLRSGHSRDFNPLRVDMQIYMRSKNIYKVNKQMNGNQCDVNETLATEK